MIPHGTTWGMYTPSASDWKEQITREQHDPARQTLIEVFSGHGTSEECVALAWTLRQPWVVSIPKASSLQHVRANYEAISLDLLDEDLADLDRDYPAPTGATRLVIT